VTGLSGAVAVAAGGLHTLALKSDGTVWAWGDNEFGQFGNRTDTGGESNFAVPGMISGGSTVDISGGLEYSVALLSIGLVSSAGDNTYGQLGTRSNESSSWPNYSLEADAIAVAAGSYHTVALTFDGRVWAWGLNAYGQLGNGSNTNSNFPAEAVLLKYTVPVPQGEGVTVDLGPLVEITFDKVSGGSVTATLISTNNLPSSANFEALAGPAYDITANAEFSGPITVCIDYNPALLGGTREQDLTLQHFVSGAWQDITLSVDTVAKKVCGQTNSLSPFVLALPVTVVDTTPPTITAASANPSVLWPPNHKMVGVAVNYTATDDSGQPACQISSVTSNEPISSSDFTIVDANHVKLSAERLGSGNGRIYNITITCADASGNSSSEAVTVTVPHDRGK
jgi:hypothetical protein